MALKALRLFWSKLKGIRIEEVELHTRLSESEEMIPKRNSQRRVGVYDKNASEGKDREKILVNWMVIEKIIDYGFL